MESHSLHTLFSPTSIAVVGASDRIGSVGMKVFKNLLHSKFQGKLFAVNPKHKRVQDHPCFASIKKINHPVDLVIIASPARTVPNIIKECGEQGIKTVVVISSGFSETGSEDSKKLESAMLDAAKKHQVRIVGPNCLGIMRPSIKMNATFDNNFSYSGSIAFASQSGALSAGILDWAIRKRIGFSTMISLGNNADIDFSDILDYFALDEHTKSILLYIEGIKNPRRFMSSLRAAARIKPVIVIKAGKNQDGGRAALSHTGALIGNDNVFDTALRRAGAVRVQKIEDLFSVSELLASKKKFKGNRLVVVTNGGGAGVIAADRAHELKVKLSTLEHNTIVKLSTILPEQWSHQNPIDIIGDATPERYHDVFDICNNDPNIDAILAILVPVAMSHPLKVAKGIINDAIKTDKMMLTSWMGEKHVETSRKLFAKHHLPHFDTPEKAIEAFSYLANYYHNQQLLMQIPERLTHQFIPDVAKAKIFINEIISSGRVILTESESKHILSLFGIPVIKSIEANSPDAAVKAAKSLGFPVAMKINSSDISHKAAAGGVYLNLNNDHDVETTYQKMMDQIKANHPEAKILGVTIEAMYQSKFDREIMVGIINDRVFGPVISFGAGGSLVEIINDTALALPPLNHFIANQLISSSRILSIPSGKFHGLTDKQHKTIITILLRISDLICELPHISEMDINPFILNEAGMIAVDARIVVKKPASDTPYAHLVISPYPYDLITDHQLPDKTNITIRPIRPEDAESEHEFIKALSPQSRYYRFMGNFHELSRTMLIRLTQIDYDHEMALVATDEHGSMLGIAQYARNPDYETAEFGLVVTDAWQGKGVGSALMNRLAVIAKRHNLKALIGFVLTDNTGMLELVKSLGYQVTKSDDPLIKKVWKEIH